MANGQITWEQFITSNNDARGVKSWIPANPH